MLYISFISHGGTNTKVNAVKMNVFLDGYSIFDTFKASDAALLEGFQDYKVCFTKTTKADKMYVNFALDHRERDGTANMLGTSSKYDPELKPLMS
mmetsp:Transcript_5306/g.4490  ORF Transcript_5306/g.4490 Transcript_5306/m.4490 type:complete len:95 (-) Transcript_5306:20-304(-)